MITLHIRKGSDFIKLKQPYPTYREAVIHGQELANHGNFYVETDYVPSRDEQLLGMRKSSSKRSRFLQTI